jgi:hypothetical protein
MYYIYFVKQKNQISVVSFDSLAVFWTQLFW